MSFIDPGPANRQHVFIEDCSQCHTQVATNLSELFGMGVAGFNNEHQDVGRKCLGCHVTAENAFVPHGEAVSVLNAISIRLAQTSDQEYMRDRPVACATCHSIHQQDEPNGIKALTDGQCQVCHLSKHMSFARDHPAFKRLPAITPQILFDHQRHDREHFAKNNLLEHVPANCTTCHRIDSNDDLQFTGFDLMCADCHLRPDIIDKQLDAIGPTSLIAIPRLDTKQLAIGYWPNCRTTRFKRLSDMPLVMRAMLETDVAASAAIALLESQKTRLHLMKKSSDKERAAATQLAWSIKAMVQDFAADNAVERFSPGSQHRKISNSRLARVIAQVPADIRRRLAESWFPSLDEELQPEAEIHGGSCPDSKEWSAMRGFIEKKKKHISGNSGWYLQAKSSYMALSYVSQQHRDTLMKSLAEVISDYPQDLQQDAQFQCAKCHGIATPDGVYALRLLIEVSPRKTEFTHASHIAVGQSCDQCHQLKDGEEPDPVALADHHPIKNDQCTGCHNGNRVQQQCTHCHSYHWQDFSAPPPPGQALVKKKTARDKRTGSL